MSRHLRSAAIGLALRVLLTAWLAIGVAAAQPGERHERGGPAEHGFRGAPGGFRGAPGWGHFAGPVAADRGFHGGAGFAGRAAPVAMHNGWNRVDPGWHGVAGAGWGWHGGWDPGWGTGWRVGWGWGGPWFWNGIMLAGGPFALVLTPPVFIAPLPIFVAPPPIVAAIPFEPPAPPPVVVAATPPPAPAPLPLVVAPAQLIAAAAPPPILVLPPPPILVAAVPPLFVAAPVGLGFFITPPTLAFVSFNFGVWRWHGWGGPAFVGRPTDPHVWHPVGWPAAHAVMGGHDPGTTRFGATAGWHGFAGGGGRWSGGGYRPVPGRVYAAHAGGFSRGREERR
jgi:hypothetical protein